MLSGLDKVGSGTVRPACGSGRWGDERYIPRTIGNRSGEDSEVGWMGSGDAVLVVVVNSIVRILSAHRIATGVLSSYYQFW